MARIPAGAVTTSLLLLSLLLAPLTAFAQKTVQPIERSALQRDLEDNIMCQCSCHQPMGSCQMRPNCGHYDEQKAKIETHLKDGKDRDGVLLAFVAEYGGQDVLAAPIDRGFNRLAWIVPYAVGVTGLVLGGAARRALVAPRRPDRWPSPARRAPTTRRSNARLNDELRDLD